MRRSPKLQEGIRTIASPARRLNAPLALGAGIVLLHSLIVLAGSLPLLQDYPDWVYQAQLLSMRLLGGAVPEPYVLKTYPVPNALTTLGVAALSMVMPWWLAAKLFLVVGAIFVYGAFVTFVAALDRQRAVWLLAVFPTMFVFGVLYWYGNSNYIVGLGFSILAAAMHLRRRLSGWRAVVLSVLAFLTHGLHYLFVSALVIASAVASRRYRSALALVPSAAICAWYLYGRYAVFGNLEQVQLEPSLAYGTAQFIAFKANTLVKATGLVNPHEAGGSVLIAGLGEGGYLALLAVAGLAVVAIVVILLGGWFSALRGNPGTDRHKAALHAVLAAGFLVYLALPQHWLGIADAGQRVLMIVLPLLLAMALPPRPVEYLLLATVGILAVVNLALAVAYSFGNPPAGRTSDRLPGFVQRIAAVQPSMRAGYYAAITEENWTMRIFPTAMFLMRPVAGPAMSHHAP